IPSRDFTSEDLFSSRMMSMQSSTHSSQMNTVGPAISFRTSCWLLPQNEQYSVFLESLVPTLLIPISVRRSIPYARPPHSGNYRIPGITGTEIKIEQNSYQKRAYVLNATRIAANSNPPRS